MQPLIHRTVILMICGVFFSANPLWAGQPTEEIRSTTDKILGLLQSPELHGKEHDAERRRRIRAVVDERFDWEAIARSSLTRHWNELSRDQQVEFTRLFATLMERTYMDHVENYNGEEINYIGEETDGARGIVLVKIVTRKNQDIGVEYRVRKEGDVWLVYDVLIEGVSMVRNYRAQFSQILAKSPFEVLLERLEAKLESHSR
jgi:phospholipid transport system substrate-binding protein